MNILITTETHRIIKIVPVNAPREKNNPRKKHSLGARTDRRLIEPPCRSTFSPVSLIYPPIFMFFYVVCGRLSVLSRYLTACLWPAFGLYITLAIQRPIVIRLIRGMRDLTSAHDATAAKLFKPPCQALIYTDPATLLPRGASLSPSCAGARSAG